MAVENPWTEVAGVEIASEDAWRVLDDWRVQKRDVGMLFCGRSGAAVIAGMCQVRELRSGLLQMKGAESGASMNLKLARFTYGPMQVWLRWPAGPTAEVLALNIYLASGDWLVLAEGYVPRELAPLALAM